ncbi:MAG TPA: DMT family transporter [Thermohalobaculum sp.]|nr:DMT family transporter [Thermohalobaculum sp.]
MRSIPDTPQAGVALMASAMMFAPLMDMFAKLLTDTMSPGAIGLARFAVQSLILLPFVFWVRQWSRPTLWHVVAGCLLGAGLVALNAALKHMPVPNVIAIFFVEPLILTLMSAYILGEGLGWRRLAAVSVGLVGALVVIRPNWQAFGPAAVYPLFTAVCFASYLLITRVVAQRGRRVALQFWVGLFAAAALLVAVVIGDGLGLPAFAATWPGRHEMWLILGMGLVAALGHQMIVNAFARAEAGALAPLQYLEIISAVLIGWFVFGDFPDALTWTGTAIIIGAGLYVIHRERRLAQRQAMLLAEPGGGVP